MRRVASLVWAFVAMAAAGAQSANAAPLFTDKFENGASRWTPVSGIWSICPQAVGYAYCQSDPYFTPPISLAGSNQWVDYYVQASVTLNDDVKGRAAILGRVHDRYNFYELRLEKDATGAKRWWLYKSVSNTFTALASGPFEYQRGTPYLLRLQMISPLGKTGYVSTRVYHDESILRLMLEGLGVTKNMLGAGAFATNMNEFFR